MDRILSTKIFEHSQLVHQQAELSIAIASYMDGQRSHEMHNDLLATKSQLGIRVGSPSESDFEFWSGQRRQLQDKRDEFHQLGKRIEALEEEITELLDISAGN
jgi:hypothetical protein